jgi:serine/tyrosine/threonine adenylyltransferase
MRRATTRLHRQVHRLHPLPRRFFHTMSPPASSETSNDGTAFTGLSLEALPKSHVFTSNLPPDPLIPTPEASKQAPKQHLRTSRPVQSALFTWVRPEPNENPQLLATSPKAVADLGLDPTQVATKDFAELMSGNKIYEEHYPWGSMPL